MNVSSGTFSSYLHDAKCFGLPGPLFLCVTVEEVHRRQAKLQCLLCLSKQAQ